MLVHPPGVGEVMVSIIGPNRVIAKDVKLFLLLLCQMRDINSISRGNALALNRRKIESNGWLSATIGI